MKSVTTGIMCAPGALLMNAQSCGKCSNFFAIRSDVKIVSFVLKARSLSTISVLDFSHLRNILLCMLAYTHLALVLGKKNCSYSRWLLSFFIRFHTLTYRACWVVVPLECTKMNNKYVSM